MSKRAHRPPRCHEERDNLPAAPKSNFDSSTQVGMTESQRKVKKTRLDRLLVERGLYESRQQAQRAIMAGNVRIDEQIAKKPSLLVTPDAQITILAPPRFVSRGGLKLEGALDYFALDVREKIAADIGASTGGFTDCLLQRGARRVYAIDVGYGQLAWKIRNNPRVIVLEKVNARMLSAALIPEPIDLCVIDVSFISLTLILPNAFALLRPNGVVLVLIKPQFELERSAVTRGGIVRDPGLHQKAKRKIGAFIEKSGHELSDVVPSVITGADGNQEFFVCARKRSG
jgi:23S rRNA (cytidine1920-2'-O)/16S rRNA (cytidine1409-2'-O)-methyltransferase